jgi:hypothetical protein
MIAQITIATLNVNSLSFGSKGRTKNKKLRALIQKSKPRTEILLLQDHRLHKDDCLLTMGLPLKHNLNYWNKAHYKLDTGCFIGGTSILTSTRLAPYLEASGVILPARAQFILLKLSSTYRLGVITVYAYNSPYKRVSLWKKTMDYDLLLAHWVMGADFNLLESLCDKRGGNPSLGMNRREKQAWRDLVQILGLQDPFHMDEFARVGSKLFSWDNKQRGPANVMTRIDRFYLSGNLLTQGGATGIWPVQRLISDHSAAFIILQQQGKPPWKPPPFAPALLDSQPSRDHLLSLWRIALTSFGTDRLHLTTATTLSAIKVHNDKFIIERNKHWSKQYYNQISAIREVEEDLENAWDDPDARAILDRAHTTLEAMRLHKQETSENRATNNWIQTGDCCSKDFFKIMKGFKSKAPIKSLNRDGQILTDPQDIKEYIHHYYNTLYVVDPQTELSEAAHAAHAQCLCSIPCRVTEEQN